MAAVRFLVFLAAVPSLSAGITLGELSQWCSSSKGLQLDTWDADVLATKNVYALDQCGVTVAKLQDLKDKMDKKIGFDIPEIRANVFTLAEQHVVPDTLYNMWYYLYSGYTYFGGLGLLQPDAKRFSLEMVLANASPDNVKNLYKEMYGYGGLGFKQSMAQGEAIKEAKAGTDSKQFAEIYKKTKDLDQAILIGVEAQFSNLQKRYAKDGKPYTATEMHDYYGAQWLNEWLAAPFEKKVSENKHAYTMQGFYDHYGTNAQTKYRAASAATQKRLADDKKAYNVAGFLSYYADAWQQKWKNAPETVCDECGPYKNAARKNSVVVV